MGVQYTPSDFNAVVQTVAGEAANQTAEGQRAVASTVLNRHALQGGNIADIASDRKTYNAIDRKAVPGTPLYDTIAANVTPVFKDGPTTRATHYYNPDLQAKLGRKPPGWDNGQGTRIGDHVFYDRADLLDSGPSDAEIQGQIGKAPKPGRIGSSPPPAPGGPSDAEIQGQLNGRKPPGTSLTASQRAAAADASSLESAITAQGAMLSSPPTPRMGGRGATGVDMVSPLIHGLSQGFSDEAKGKLFGVATGAKNFVLNALGKPIPYSMKEAEAAETRAARHTLAAISKAHPIASTAAEITGGVAPWLVGGEVMGPAKVVAKAPTALGRLAQVGGRVVTGGAKGAALGATGGAVNAFGNAEGEAADRLAATGSGAATGAVLGGALGAAAPVVAPVVGKVVHALGREVSAGAGAGKQGVTNALDGLSGKPVEVTAKEYFQAKSPAAQRVAGMMTPPDLAESVVPTPEETAQAQTRVMQMMGAKGMHTDDLRAIPEDIPHTTAEAIGSQTVNHLASLARRAGATPDAAATQIAQRAQEFGDSILDDFGRASGIHPEEAKGGVDALVGRLKGEADPLFAAVRSHPGPVWNADLAQISQRPVVAKAIDAAANDLRNGGKDPLAAGFRLNPETGLYELNGNTLDKTVEHQPTAETWENVRQRLGEQVDRFPNGKPMPDSMSRGNYNINAAKRDLTTILAGDAKGAGALIPGYRNALDASGEYLSAQSAFDRGGKSLLTDKVTPRAFEKDFKALTSAEQQAWRAGVANKLYDQAQTRTGLTPSMLKAPAFQAKIRTIMGDGADEFLDRLTQRVRLHATGARIMPGAGSQTTPLLQAADESAPVTDALGNIIKGAAHAKASPVTFAIKHGLKAGLRDLGPNVAETPGYRNAYGRLLLQHPRVTADELRSAARSAPVIRGSRLPIGATAGQVGAQTSRPSQ